jgi:localization factor PodJL
MASEASWQTSSAGGGSNALPTDQPMDQRTVESLLRRLVERVEDSERRYGKALDELHVRLDQISQTTEAARDTGAPEDTDTFDRLHTQVSKLARRLEQDTTPLDDFERLGKALSDQLGQGTPDPSPFAQAAMAANPGQASGASPGYGFPDFGYAPEIMEATDAPKAFDDHGDLDKRLVEMAQRLEESIGTAMPTGAIEALNTRLDEIGGQLSQAFDKAPTREALEHVERQITEIGQQLGRAEEQLGKVSGVEAQLLKLIERLDEKAAAPAQIEPAQLEAIASKAAAEAARLVAGDAKQNGDRLVSTLEAVHASLRQLVQQVEKGAPPKPRAPFRQAEAKPSAPMAPTPQTMAKAAKVPSEPKAKTAPRIPEMLPEKPVAAAATNEKSTLRDRLGATIPDFKETEPQPPFGRAKRLVPEEEAIDLDAAAPPRRSRSGMRLGAGAAATAQGDADPGTTEDAPDDLVAAARRAAQAAAARAEERSGRRPASALPGSAATTDQPGRRKRSMLIIAAAILLALSAALLYGRLSSKPETDVTPAATEESAPADATEGAATPGGAETAPTVDPDQSGWVPLDDGVSPTGNVGQAPTGFTEVAKSSGRVPAMPAGELNPEPKLASLKPMGQAPMPPGVYFSIEDPALGAKTKAAALGAPVTPSAPFMKLPMPPMGLGSPALREAAANGEAKAQYIVGIRYADGQGTKRDLKAAATWLERAAEAGLAPAQYRLAAMYERGVGVGKDLDKARSWYMAAAVKGNVKAMHNLAVSVSGREGGDPDYTLAAKWYGEAAAHGLADSQFNLGILAEHGLGTAKDLEEAYKWFSLAARKGDKEAAKRREVIRAQLAPAALAEAEAEVKAWTARPADAEANEVTQEAAWAGTAPVSGNATLVTRAQTELNKLGYDVGPADGVAGNRTRDAIKLFQKRNGLAETGEISPTLVTKLEHLSS